MGHFNLHNNIMCVLGVSLNNKGGLDLNINKNDLTKIFVNSSH